MVKLVIKKNLTNERDNCDQILFRLLLKEGYTDHVHGRPVSWVSHCQHPKLYFVLACMALDVTCVCACVLWCLASIQSCIVCLHVWLWMSLVCVHACVLWCLQMEACESVSFEVAMHKIRHPSSVRDALHASNIPATSFFAHGHINGHHYRVPLRQREGDNLRSTYLLAYFATDATPASVNFGDLIVFTRDSRTGINYAVVGRRPVTRHSAKPFYVCVPESDVYSGFVVVPVRRMVCACSELVMPGVVPPMRMVLFHQISGALHQFA